MRRCNITLDRLREVLHYDPSTGVFVWLKKTGKKTIVGSQAGSIRSDGYMTVSIDKCIYYGHVLAWFYITGERPDMDLDHKDGNPSNNCFTNLRLATGTINYENLHKARCHNSTGLLGVRRTRFNTFNARIVVNGIQHNLGNFDTPELAHAIYIDAKRRVHPGCMI